jgi:hypothetical protein
MPPETHLTNIARVIQLSVAPVFLLTALGTFLGVLSTRLGRIVDRARRLAEQLPGLPALAQDFVRGELAVLVRRRKLVNAAITCATTAALLVCVLIASAFIGSLVRADASHLLAALFILAMLAFIGALVTFLAEVLYAVRSVKIEPR